MEDGEVNSADKWLKEAMEEEQKFNEEIRRRRNERET